jgi:hypothetical protein
VDFKGDKNLQHDFFIGKVKPAVSCRKMLHAKDPSSMKEMVIDKIHGPFSACSSCFVTRCPLVTFRELWWVNQKLLEFICGSPMDQ